MTRLVVGIIGHVDHGKTALVRALTGQDTDRLAEEKQRGISIALGFAHFKASAEFHIDLIDMPGHEKFVRTMISGATGLDAVLLTVAANEGVKPQTIEHVDIAGLLGLRRAVIAITKTDLASPEEALRAAASAEQLLRNWGIDSAPAILTSAPSGLGVEDLRSALIKLAAELPQRSENGIAFLPIDRAFSMPGHGPVVTGTLRGAAIEMGDELELLPARRSVRARSAQVHGQRVAIAEPGQRVALNLRGIDLADLNRGMALAEPGALAPSDWLTISIRAVDSAPPIKNGKRVRVLLGTEELNARLRLLDRDILQPGESGFAQLHCAEAIALPAKEPVILRLDSPAQTIAGGKILQPVTQRLKRNDAQILQRLDNLRSLPAAELIASEIDAAGRTGVSLARLSQMSALGASRVGEIVKTLPAIITRSDVAISKTALDDVMAQIPKILAPHAGGLSQDALLTALPKTSAAVSDEALARLISRNAIAKRSGNYLVPRPEDDRLRARNESELTAHIIETLRQGGLAPPTPADIAANPQARHAVERLVKDGLIIRAVDRAKNKEILFHKEAIEDAQRVLSPLLMQGDGLLATEIGAALGVSRKYTMPLLDHLDAIKFTRRVNDRRVLAKTSP